MAPADALVRAHRARRDGVAHRSLGTQRSALRGAHVGGVLHGAIVLGKTGALLGKRDDGGGVGTCASRVRVKSLVKRSAAGMVLIGVFCVGSSSLDAEARNYRARRAGYGTPVA